MPDNDLRFVAPKFIAILGVILTVRGSYGLIRPSAAKGVKHENGYVHRFSDGSTLELIAISDSKFVRSWQPDGRPITISKSRIARTNELTENGTFVLLRLKMAHPYDWPFGWFPLIETNPYGGGIGNLQGKSNEFECVRRIDNAAGPEGPIQIFYAFDEFKQRATTIYKNLTRVSGIGFGNSIKPLSLLVVQNHEKAHYEDGGFSVDFDSGFVDDHNEKHVIAIGKNGKVYQSIPWTNGSKSVTFMYDRSSNPYWEQVDARNVAKLSMITRPISTFNFKSVVLKR